MKKYIIGIICILLTAGSSWAQEKEVFKRKFTNHTEFGGLFGRVRFGSEGNKASQNRLNISAQTFNGIMLTSRLTTGLTVGMDWYKAALISPIALGARYDITKGKSAQLYATADAGYGFAWFHEDSDGYKTKGGMMINPGIGIRYGKPGGKAFTMGLSWKRQEVDVNKPPFWQQTERNEHRNYNRLALRIGMIF